MKLLLFFVLLTFPKFAFADQPRTYKEAIDNEHNNVLCVDKYDYERYNTLQNIHNELRHLAKDKPDMVTLIDIGQSVENRTLLVIKLSGKPKIATGIKASMWVDAGIHAREWIAPATAMYMIKELVQGYESDPTIQNLLDHVNFYVLPVMNPDGYEYTWTKDRFWRKNRRPKANCPIDSNCTGVDLNRNFDWHFGVVSENATINQDPGPSAFSEPESLAVKSFLESNIPEAYISLHSYGQMWLTPFTHKNETHPENSYTHMKDLAIRATDALSKLYGTVYKLDTDTKHALPGGCSHDWAAGVLNVSYAYTVELRSNLNYTDYSMEGFKLPVDQISETGLETFEAIKVVAEQLVEEFVLPKLKKIDVLHAMKLFIFFWFLVLLTLAGADQLQFYADLFDNQQKPYNKELYGNGYDYDRFNPLADIHNELARLARQQPDMVTLFNIGQSVENRSLLVIKLFGRNSIPAVYKTSLWLDAGIHAREWIAPATAMYMIKELVNGYDTDSRIRNLLDHMNFYILPVVNPDGYEYTWINDTTRFWRKNRRHGSQCTGVDLNRNFDYHFDAVESEYYPCEENYHGTAPFSEPESFAVKNFLEKYKPEAYINLHSFGRMWFLPYSYKKGVYPADFGTDMLPLAIRATKALSGVFGNKYKVGAPADLLGYQGMAGGTTVDWAKGYLNVTYAYGIELGPGIDELGPANAIQEGFVVPNSEIRKSGLETFEAIKVVADQLVKQFVLPKLRNINEYSVESHERMIG